MQLPQEMMTHIAGFMADDLQATDPACYRECPFAPSHSGVAMLSETLPTNACAATLTDPSGAKCRAPTCAPACALPSGSTPPITGAFAANMTAAVGLPRDLGDFDLLESPREGPSDPIWHWPS